MRAMRTTTIYLTTAAAVLCLCTGADWPGFRGPDNRSISGEGNLPLSFDQQRDVAWKVPLPGAGPSGPIAVDGRVVVTAASGARQDRLHVLCFDAQTGQLQWERQLWATGHVVVDPFGGVAAPTPVSDGRLVFAFFSSNDLACFDLQGRLKWLRGLAHDYPTVRHDVGMASSPLVVGKTVVVQLDTPGDSFVAGIDTTTGENRWRIERPSGAIWASPTVLRGGTRGQDAVLLQRRDRLSAHEPHTGKLLWYYETPCHSIASATTCDGRVYLPSHGLHALQVNPAGGVELLWHQPRLSSGNASPLVHDNRAYTVNSAAILVCGDTADGEVLWRLRLKGPFWATPVIAGGHLFCVNHHGLVQVVELGEKGRLVGSSQIDPKILASPAVADGAIYFRSNQDLWKIARP